MSQLNLFSHEDEKSDRQSFDQLIEAMEMMRGMVVVIKLRLILKK